MQKRRVKKSNRKPIGFLIFVLVLLIGVVSVEVSELYKRNRVLENEASSIETEKQKELDKQDYLLDFKESMNSTEYIEQLAREKFGLIKPNETLFIIKPE
ncbi:MAG: hypothetical protein CVU84_06135 [Firmicutes bacterium HGW-Firmicutes-1]|jgi:cell division protein DivIC|nr:MAG: hypothetical protein CVU84_06135 [Firmicutes bacterium HGW-Firmicutes-1]